MNVVVKRNEIDGRLRPFRLQTTQDHVWKPNNRQPINSTDSTFKIYRISTQTMNTTNELLLSKSRSFDLNACSVFFLAASMCGAVEVCICSFY